ncbi:ribonuclease H-like domain-containing protein [Tanacetum coccineum]
MSTWFAPCGYLSISFMLTWPVHQLDVKNAFLNGALSAMRSLYGLKQATRAWFQRFAGYATQAGFSPNHCDSSLFIYTQGSQVAYFLIYRDDIILTASSPVLLRQIVDSLHKEFDMTDIGALNYFLGISAVPISRSSAEEEYRGVANVVVETAWIRNLLRELHSPLLTATLVYCDNVSAVYMSANPVQHQRTKHIEIDIHFVRDMVKAGHVRILHVLSRFQYVDIFTKGLPSALFEDFGSSLSVRPPPA